MAPEDLYGHFRSEVNDLAQPFLWTDDEVYHYMNEAQKMFCRLTDGISDATTSAVVNIPLAAATEWYPLHPSILKIRGATFLSNGRPIDVLNYEDMAPKGMRFDGRTGPVRAMIIGMEDFKVRVWPMPDVNSIDSIILLVFRLPLKDITEDSTKFEIDDDHHRYLLDWMKALAYSKQDAETYDRGKSLEFEGKFRNYCEQAKIEQRRKRHKNRTMGYGGLPMSYDRGPSNDYGQNW